MKELEDYVKASLELNEKCRSSNELLYLSVCKQINLDAMSMPFYLVLNQIEKLELPTFVQVIKTKQKIMNENPRLRPADLHIGTRFEQRIITQEDEAWRGSEDD